jgi:SpoVK/Ycf46/Vps4 family AAA+-type ATPase
MREALHLGAPDERRPPPLPGRRLQRAVGALASQLSERVRHLGAATDELLQAQRELVSHLFDPAPDEQTAAVAGQPHPLDRLAAALGLSPFEVDLLVLAGFPHEHEALALLLRSLHPRGEPYPTVGLAAQLFCRADHDRLLLRGALENGSLVESGAVRLAGDVPFSERSVVVADGLWSALHGHEVWPAGVRAALGPVPESGLVEWLQGPCERAMARAMVDAEWRTLLVAADAEDTALQRAAALAHSAGARAARLQVEGTLSLELEKLLSVHCVARGVLPLVRVTSPTPAFERHPGPVVLCLRHGAAPPRTARPILSLLVERPSASARAALWRATLPDLAAQAPRLAARYALEPQALEEIAADLRAVQALEDRPPTLDDVAQAVRARSGVSGSGSVKRIRPRATWDDLVLSPEPAAQLREAVARLERQQTVLDDWGFLKSRPGARGVRLLLSGPPGTGKSLSAEVLAGALGVDLLAVDISRIVSKWIGETEKNLGEVFDAAERAQAVLFFDEADALFGVRTEVSDAHDRYANLETAYLLFRLERFEGLAVLATNLRQNVDPAFLRRLELVIDYDEPDRVQREALWKVHVPGGAPLAQDADLAELAALYPVNGGFIRNAAVAAAFLAASEGAAISRLHFVRAIRREYQKSGRAFPGYPAGMRNVQCQPR